MSQKIILSDVSNLCHKKIILPDGSDTWGPTAVCVVSLTARRTKFTLP